jgi:hypothetical protein
MMNETRSVEDLRAEVEAIEEERLRARLTQLKSLPAVRRVLADVEWERDKQNQQWGGNEHDDLHGPRDWAAFITEHLGKALDEAEREREPERHSRYRRRLVEVAAVAVAAVETYDRAVEVTDGR